MRADTILVLAGLSAEMQPHARRAESIKVPDGVRKAADALLQAGGIGLERPEREDAVWAASLLHHWINPYTDLEIIEACGHDQDSVPPAGEEMAGDAYRALMHAASFAEQTRGGPEGEELAGEIWKIADFCRIGSSDELAREILGAGLDRAGRNSAIAISRRAGKGRDMRSVSEGEIVSVFPGNPAAAKSLFLDMQNARGSAPQAGTGAA